MRVSLWLFLPALLALACGPKLPPRYVIEGDVGAFKFRRFQQVLDVELPIAGNPATGYTATYVRGGKNILLAPVFITVYEHPAGLTETIRQSLRQMAGYTFEIVKREGQHVYRMQGESGDVWLLWVSGERLVKLGAPEGQSEVPEELLALYLDYYPSDLNDQGKAKKGARSAGPMSPSGGPSPAPAEAL